MFSCDQVTENLTASLDFADWLLQPLYQSVSQTAPPATAPAEHVMQDFILFQTENSEVPIFDSELDPFNPNLFMADPPNAPIQTFNYSAIWPHWRDNNYVAPNLVSNLWG